MKNSPPIIRCLCVAVAMFLMPSGLANAAVKVVSWNLEWFPGHRPTASAAEADEHMKQAQAALKEINPDIFIGIEVRDWASFNELVSVVPGLTTHVVSNFIDPETAVIRPQQIGIASKLKCIGADSEPWKANVPLTPRGFSFAALEQKDGTLLMVYGNHFKSNRGTGTDEAAKQVADMRNDQAKQLLAHQPIIEKAFEGKKISGWIAAGDFNTNTDNQFPLCHAVELLTAGGFRNTWEGIDKEKRLTWRGDKTGKFQPTTFDYIFTKGLGDLTDAMIDSPREVSDHHAITVPLP